MCPFVWGHVKMLEKYCITLNNSRIESLDENNTRNVAENATNKSRNASIPNHCQNQF
jgi:hypothetical protein